MRTCECVHSMHKGDTVQVRLDAWGYPTHGHTSAGDTVAVASSSAAGEEAHIPRIAGNAPHHSGTSQECAG